LSEFREAATAKQMMRDP